MTSEPMTEVEYVNVVQREAFQRFGHAGAARVIVALRACAEAPATDTGEEKDDQSRSETQADRDPLQSSAPADGVVTTPAPNERTSWDSCRDCSTAMWCQKFALCLSESNPAEHPHISASNVEPKGTYNCPICGWNSPHREHAGEWIQRLYIEKQDEYKRGKEIAWELVMAVGQAATIRHRPDLVARLNKMLESYGHEINTSRD